MMKPELPGGVGGDQVGYGGDGGVGSALLVGTSVG